MNENFKKLAEEAGFCFWEDESWQPEGQLIDWSCNYEEEFKKFGELVVQ